jgi:hypothetical protein
MTSHSHTVMPGLVPGILIKLARYWLGRRDGRDKPGHDRGNW